MLLKVRIYAMIYFAKFFYGFGKISTSLIYAQAVHETGDFKSAIFKENKNLFGGKKPSVRKTFAVSNNRGHAVFESYFNCIRDYFERQKYFKISNQNDTEFIRTTVASGYAEDPQYRQKWEAIFKTVKKPISGMHLGFLFFFLLVSISLMARSNKSNTNKIKFKK